MYLNSIQFRNLDEKRLIEFLELRIPEGVNIDYKQDISSSEKGKTYKEFLKDVTAFANASGGDIIIGVKEPSEDLLISDQITGIEKGEEIAQSLERIAATSIDPRVSGLGVKAILLSTGKYVIVVHIPASINRPHMVNYDGHRSFYIRHSESSFPMSTHEIRQSIIANLSAEENIKSYFHSRELDFINYFLDEKPAFLIQAMPLIPLESTWNVLGGDIEKVVRGTSMSYSDPEFDISSSIAPQPSIDGIIGRENRNNSKWQTEVHRNGYISISFKNRFLGNNVNDKSYFVHSGFCHLFENFMEFVSKLTLITNTDLPYIIGCKYFGAQRTKLYADRLFSKYTDAYYKDEIIFPLHYRAPGHSFQEIADQLSNELFNAFGLKEVIE